MVTVDTFSPGFRISKLDVLVLIAGGVGSIVLGSWDVHGGCIVAFVVGHFFLFCNILRMSRPLELIWAAVFSTLAGIAIASGAIAWPIVFIGAGVLTLLLGIIEMRRPSYHGVGWKRLNPDLPRWWAEHAR